MKVTAEMLRKTPACKAQVEMFADQWPRGMTVNKTNLRRAIQLGFSVEQGLNLLASHDVWKRYAQATWKRYLVATKKIGGLGWHDALCSRAWRAYLRSIIPDILAAAKAMDRKKK